MYYFFCMHAKYVVENQIMLYIYIISIRTSIYVHLKMLI